MSIYVDPLFEHPKRNAEGFEWCHMRADSIDELHEFARLIGRNRCWFHKGDHYDLTPSSRERAVTEGAIELTALEFSRMVIAQRRAKHQLELARDLNG